MEGQSLTLGIDPGTRHLGFGLIARSGNRLTHIAHGVISPPEKWALADRLCVIEERLVEVIQTHRPAAAAVETLFFHKDPQAAAKLGHARGVVLLVLARGGVAIAEYAPSKVKQTVAGNGQASKEQVALMVRAMLGLAQLPALDATDALALALTHQRIAPLQQALAAQSERRDSVLKKAAAEAKARQAVTLARLRKAAKPKE